MKEYNKEECDKECDNFLELLEHDNLANVKYEGNTKMTSVDRKGNDLVHTFRVQLSKEEMIEKYRGTIYLPF